MSPRWLFADLDDDAVLAEEFIKYLITVVLSECAEDMEFFNKRIDKTILDTLNHVKDSDFVRISYTDAIENIETVRTKV